MAGRKKVIVLRKGKMIQNKRNKKRKGCSNGVSMFEGMRPSISIRRKKKKKETSHRAKPEKGRRDGAILSGKKHITIYRKGKPLRGGKNYKMRTIAADET